MLDFSKETEWYENVRNGFIPLCDRCNENICKEEFDYNRNDRGVYCGKCWNWIHLRKWKCLVCNGTGTHRGDKKIVKSHCGEEVVWLQ